MSICKTCENSYCHYAKTDVNQVVSCSGYTEPKKPTTNADRIRAMSDEGLENFIRKVAIRLWEPWCDRHCRMDVDDNCNRCLANWLQQPAEVE